MSYQSTVCPLESVETPDGHASNRRETICSSSGLFLFYPNHIKGQIGAGADRRTTTVTAQPPRFMSACWLSFLNQSDAEGRTHHPGRGKKIPAALSLYQSPVIVDTPAQGNPSHRGRHARSWLGPRLAALNLIAPQPKTASPRTSQETPNTNPYHPRKPVHPSGLYVQGRR